MKRLTITDVSRHAGVSKSTVSQYLNKRYEYMSYSTKKRIEDSIKELNYQPNTLARSLKVKSSKTIGVIVANILHQFSTQVIRSIEDTCHESDFHIIVCNADDDSLKEKKYINMLYEKQVDGLIIFPTGGNKELYKRFREMNFPIIFMDRFIPEINIQTVLLDNEKASELAVNEFINKGYKSIGILTASVIKNVTPRIERVLGFEKSIKKNGLPLLDEYIRSADIENIQGEFEQLISLPHPPDAVLAGNDLVLIEILKFVNKHKLSIPKDIALIGIDEVSISDLYSPPLTTIKQPTFEMGKLASTLLLNIINKTDSLNNELYRIKPELIRRESC